MYKIFGFRKDKALGRVALVEFSTPVEREETYAYLLGSFNAFNEGSFRMSKAGGRWKIETELPEGLWHYAFSWTGATQPTLRTRKKTTYKRRSYKFERTASVARITGDEEVFHVPSLLYLYTFSTRTHVLLRAKGGSMEGVALITNEKVPMQKKGSDGLFDYFEAVVPAEKRMEYSFEAQMKDGRIEYLGSFEAIPSEIGASSWVLESVFYQIMPDRFAIGLKRKGLPAKGENSHGGDLRGIRDHLNHLLELGVDGLYLTPIFESKTYNGYDVEDYSHVARRLGGDEEFDVLVRELKGMGIRLIFDGVFHHTSFFHPYFQDLIRNGEKSKYREFYRIKGVQ